VQDTGPRIAPDIADKIFNPYFTTTDKGKGTGNGLGLARVQGIVKNYGGFIDVQSEACQGTAFHVFIPSIEQHPSSEDGSGRELSAGNDSILVVDDEPLVTEVIREIRVQQGCCVTETWRPWRFLKDTP
jgi:two-component system, cell cycle sensor histidine kinase and response regulator CckA